MLSNQQTRDYLISAFECLKEDTYAVHSAMTEISAIRDALVEIGPKYGEILARHRERHIAEGKKIADEYTARFDAMIRVLKTL